MTRPPRSKLRQIGVNVALLIGVSLICAVILETAVRITLPVYSPAGRIHFECIDGMYLAPKNVQLRQWTNTGDFDVTVWTNQQGFRDVKDLRDANANDLLVIGDSFSFGHGVQAEDRYSNRLESALGQRVYNVSIPTNLDGYLRMARYADEVSQGVGKVILGICMENDISNYGAAPRACTPRKDLTKLSSWIENPSTVTLMDVKLLLTTYSAAYSAITSIVHQNSTLKAIGLRLGLLNETVFAGAYGYDESKIVVSANRLAQIAYEFDIIALIIPSRALWQGDNQETESRIHNSFVAEIAKHEIQTLDLRPVFERSGHPLEYHFRHDAHWNSEGHRVAAEELLTLINAR